MNKKILAAVSAACMIANTSAVCAAPVSAEDSDGGEKIKIMALGDSITDGYWTSGGYRKYLYHELEIKGCTNIDMVGAKGSDSLTFDYNGETITYDDNHSGYSGYAIQKMTEKEYREGILETVQGTWYEDGKNMIQACDPDIILLQIGTNDILSGYNDGITERLENLVNVILEDMTDPTDILYVSTIPDIDAVLRADWLGAYGINAWTSTDEEKEELMTTVQGYIDSYNESIYNMVLEMQSLGKAVKFADINSVVDYKEDLYDGVHPNEQGYENMGRYWANLLDEELSGKTPEEEPTTTAVTELTTIITTAAEEIETTTVTATDFEKPEKTYTIADAVNLSEYIFGRYEITPEDNFDVNSDNIINVFDLIEMKRIISKK